MPAVALTDQGNLFGMIKFYRKALAHGIKPLIGVDLCLRNSEEPDRPFTLLLLCQNLDGYRNLNLLSTLEGFQHGATLLKANELVSTQVVFLKGLSVL